MGIGPGSAVRTLTLFLTADSASLNSTLYRSSLEVSRFQSATASSNAAAGRARLAGISQQAAADISAANAEISQVLRVTTAHIKARNEEVFLARRAAAERVRVDEQASIKILATQTRRNATAASSGTLTSNLAAIQAEKDARLISIREVAAADKAAAKQTALERIAIAKTSAAEEIAIAETTGRAKNGRFASIASVTASATARRDAEIIAAKEAEAIRLSSIEKTATADRLAARATASQAVADTRAAAAEKLAIELDRIELQTAAANAASKEASAVAIAQARKTFEATTAMAIRNAEIASGARGAVATAGIEARASVETAAAEREIASTARRTAVFGALKTSLLAVGIASAIATAESIKFATAFETELRNVASISTQLRGNEQAIQAVGTSILNISRVLPKDAKDLAGALYEITSAGFNDNTAGGLKVLEESAKAAVAGLTTADTAAKGLTEVLNAYGKSAEEAGAVSDVLFQTVNLGVVTFEELSKTLGTSLGTAASAKVSIQELGAAYAAITRAGIGPEETSTSLARVITSFIAPTKELSALTKSWGYDTAANALAQEGLYKSIERVRIASQGDLAVVYKLFPEKRALRGVLAAIANEGRTYAETFNGIGRANAAAGSTAAALKEQMQSLSAQLQLLKNRAVAVGIELAGPIVNWFKDAIPKIEAFAKAIGKDAVDAFNVLRPLLVNLVTIGSDLWTIFSAVVDVIVTALKPELIAIGAVLTVVTAAIQKVTGFFARNEGAVKLLAVAITVALLPAMARLVTAFAVNSFASFAGILIKMADGFAGAGIGAAGYATEIAKAGTVSTKFGLASTAAGLSLSSLGAGLLAIAPYALVAVGAYEILTHALDANAAAQRRAKAGIKALIDTEDLKSVRGLDKALVDLKEHAVVETQKAKDAGVIKPKPSAGARAVPDAVFAQPDVARNIRGIKVETEKTSAEINNSKETIKANVKGVNDQLANLYNIKGFKLSEESISYRAAQLGLDLTKSFDQSAAARDRLAAFFKEELPAAYVTAGYDFSKLSADMQAQMIDLSNAADKTANEIAKTFRKAFDPVENFKLIRSEDFKQNDLSKQLAVAEKQLAALEKKRKSNGQTANETDTLTAAEIRLGRAFDDTANKKEKFQRVYEGPQALIQTRNETKAAYDEAKKLEDDLKARKAGGDKTITDERIGKAHDTAREKAIAYSRTSKELYEFEQKDIDKTGRAATTTARKREDAERALAIAKRKATDNPFSDADAQEVERLTDVVKQLKVEVNAAKEAEVKPEVQLANFYKKQIADANKFNEDISTILKKGIDPNVVLKILQQGPREGKDFLDALVSDLSQDTINKVNNAEKSLNKITERAFYLSRLQVKATQADDTTLLGNLRNATRIQDAVLNAKPGVTAEEIQKTLPDLNVKQIKEIATQFGILSNPVNGVQKSLAGVVEQSTKAEQKLQAYKDLNLNSFQILGLQVSDYAKTWADLVDNMERARALTEGFKNGGGLGGTPGGEVKATGFTIPAAVGSATATASPRVGVPVPSRNAASPSLPTPPPSVVNTTNFNGPVSGTTPEQAAKWAAQKKKLGNLVGERRR